MRLGIDAVFRKRTTAGPAVRSALKFAAAACLALGLSGCLTYDGLSYNGKVVHGYQVDPHLLSQIKVGSSAEQVLVVMGTPSTTSTVGGGAWYYITQVTNQPLAFMSPHIVKQHVLAVYFDKDKKVTRIANYGLKDGKIFDFVSRTTPTGGADSSFLHGIFRLSFG